MTGPSRNADAFPLEDARPVVVIPAFQEAPWCRYWCATLLDKYLQPLLDLHGYVKADGIAQKVSGENRISRANVAHLEAVHLRWGKVRTGDGRQVQIHQT